MTAHSNINFKPPIRNILIALLLLLAVMIGLLYFLSWQASKKSSALQSQANSEVYVYPDNYCKPVSDYYTYRVDSFRTLNIRQAIRLNEQRQFQTWQHPTPFNLGMHSRDTWFYIAVKNADRHDVCLVWHLSNTLDTAQLFWKSDSAVHAHRPVSFFTPLKERALPLRAMFDTVWLKPGEQRGLYLHLWKNHYNTYVPMSLLPLHELQQQEDFHSNVYSVYIAVFLFIILFNLFLYISLRDKIHLWYIFYIASVCMILLLDAFYEVFLFPPFIHRLFSTTETLPFVDFVVIGTARVMQLLLGQTRKNSRFYRPLNILFTADFIWGAGQLIVGSACIKAGLQYPFLLFHTLSDILVFITIFLVMCGTVEKMMQRQVLAYIYFFAQMLPILGILNYYLNSVGVTDFRFLYPNSVAVGVLLEIIALTLLLTHRYNLLQKEKSLLLQQQLTLQKEMSERIAETQENEQRRIAADLHDGLGSFLAALRLTVNKSIHYFSGKGQPEPAETLREVQQRLDIAVEDIRTISHDLMPKDFEQNKFSDIIKNHLNAISSSTRLHIEYYLDPQINSVAKRIQIMLYRIFTEVMNNALKHSESKNITVQFLAHPGSLQLLVEDDGIGFKADTAHAGLGLKNIQSRVDFLKGKLTIDSTGKGAAIIIDIPLA